MYKKIIYLIIVCVFAGFDVDVSNPDPGGMGGSDGRDDDFHHEENQARLCSCGRHVLHPLPSFCHFGN